ncbi:hypothetical protein JCM10295v2_005057 [Rhodotorula toruloides]
MLAPLPAPVTVRPIGCFCCAPVGLEEENGKGMELASADAKEAYHELYGDDADVDMAGPAEDADMRGAEDGDADDILATKRPKTVTSDLAVTSVKKAQPPSILLLPRLQLPSVTTFHFDPLEELRAHGPCLLPPLVVNALRQPSAYLAGPENALPSLPPHLSVSDSFPDNGDLVFIPDVYFLKQPVEPAWSVDYYRSFARFLQACGSSDASLVYECSLAAFGCLRPGSEPLLQQSRHVTSRQPDKQVVYQNAAIAGPLDGFEQLPKVLQQWVLTMRKVLVWAMDWPGELSTGQVLRFIKEARPAAHLIVREFADVLRIRHLMHRLERQVLSSPPHPTPTDQAARRILKWMNETDDEQRQFRFGTRGGWEGQGGEGRMGEVNCEGGGGGEDDT